MRILAILLFILGIGMLAFLGFMYFFGFVMSFDAPGSAKDPKGWMVRGLLFLPIVILGVLLIVAFISVVNGKYGRAAILSGFPIAGGLIFLGILALTSFSSHRQYKAKMAQEERDAALYPKQTFLRHREGATDTIIVFPNRIVSYRLDIGTDRPWAGPLGDLNKDRTKMIYYRHHDTKLAIEELGAFVDEQGRKFVDVYVVE